MAFKRQKRLDLNPSSADRWTTCTASPGFILENWDRVPEDDSNAFSQEGTTAHEVASAYLLSRKPSPEACPTTIDADMLWHGWNYAEYVESLIQPYGRLLVEQKLPLWYMPGRNAIVDAAVMNPQEIHIVDYKYGEGIVVHPENNLQATIYATIVAKQGPPLGHEFPIFVHIYQPRGRTSSDSPFHVWETTWGEIEKAAQEIEANAKLIQRVLVDNGEFLDFAPSEKACQWCPARGFCTERQKVLTKDIEPLAVIDDKPKHLPPPQAVSVKQLSAILKHGDQIIKWIKDAKAYALSHMKGGGKLPGWKLVTSRGGHRYWTNPKAAQKLLLESHLRRDEVVEETVISPAAAEKLLGKNKFSVELTNLIGKPPGQPTIVSDDDPRESALLDGAGEFEALDDF